MLITDVLAEYELDTDEQEAVEHVLSIQSHGWPHQLHSCPPFCRAMCSYGRTLTAAFVRHPGLEAFLAPH